MAYAKSFKELTVWQKAMQLVKLVYLITQKLPSSEAFGLTSQMRRAAVSIPSNIAEGHRRHTRKDYLHFLHMANGSAAELETQLLIAEEIYQINFSEAKALLEEVQKIMAVFIKKTAAQN